MGSSDIDEEEEDEEAQDNSLSKPKSSSKSTSRSRSRLVREGILEKLPPQKGKYKKVTQRRKDAALRDRVGHWEPDMYKMMDGSALVCLGGRLYLAWVWANV